MMNEFATSLALAIALSVPAPAPTVLNLQWDYTNRFCSVDLQFEVEQSSDLVNWTPAGKSYGPSISVTSYTDHAFYRVKTIHE